MTLSDVRRILVAVELDSPDANAAVELAGMYAQASGAEVILLHVIDAAASLSGIVPGARSEQDLEPERRLALDKVEALVATLHAAGIAQVSLIVEAGYPADRILHHAQSRHTQLIVMGTHGRSGFSRLWLGSIAGVVLRGAACQVVVTRAARSTSDDSSG